MANADRIQVLLVEDSLSDAQLLCEFLQNYPPQSFALERAERQRERGRTGRPRGDLADGGDFVVMNAEIDQYPQRVVGECGQAHGGPAAVV